MTFHAPDNLVIKSILTSDLQYNSDILQKCFPLCRLSSLNLVIFLLNFNVHRTYIQFQHIQVGSLWGHQMEIFPRYRPFMRGIHRWPVKRLSKQSWGWWFQTPSLPSWRHCNEEGKWPLRSYMTGLTNHISFMIVLWPDSLNKLLRLWWFKTSLCSCNVIIMIKSSLTDGKDLYFP